MTLNDFISEAARQDRDDPLAAFRNRFHIPRHNDGECVYLCGNSLGLMPNTAAESVQRELDAWRDLGVEGHFKTDRPWVSYHELCTPHLAKIVGGGLHEVVAMNTLTVNLHLMLASFYRPTSKRFKILTGHTAFPSDRYAVASHMASRGYQHGIITAIPRAGEETLRTENILHWMDAHASELALVLMDGVNYYTGEFLDLQAITAAAHRHGILVGFDLAHAAGNVELHLHDWAVDFAVWCGYKYLNGGPGAVAGAFVHERHGLDPATPRLAGWWGHDKGTRFNMGPEFHAIPGAEGWQLSNPPLFSMAAQIASFELFSEATLPALRTKSIALTAFLERVLKSLFAEQIELLTPDDAARRGCQLSVRIKQGGKAVHQQLQAHGVICDWREPDVIRLAPVPLYNTFADIVRCAEVLTECMT